MTNPKFSLASLAECQPHIWSASSILRVGEINCREDTMTGPKVGPQTCGLITTKYGISTEELLFLNPKLDKECASIKPKTLYCVVGFPEPPRAFDGLCGPRRNITIMAKDERQ